MAADGMSSATARFSPRRHFADGSDLCIRVRAGATDFSDPTCVTIHS